MKSRTLEAFKLGRAMVLAGYERYVVPVETGNYSRIEETERVFNDLERRVEQIADRTYRETIALAIGVYSRPIKMIKTTAEMVDPQNGL